MTDLFLFGTLRHQPLLQRILGEEGALPALEPAFLPGHDTRWVAGRGHPVLVDAPEARAEGLLARDVSPAALDRLAFYEAGQGYHPQTRTVETQSGPVAAQVWLPQHAVTPGGPFDLSDWQMRWADVADVAAAEVMSHFGQSAPDAVAKRYLPIRARAAARVVHLGAVGREGAWMVERLLEYGVDTRWIATRAGDSGHAVICVDDAGENLIVIHPGANRAIQDAEVAAALDTAAPGDWFLSQNETNGQVAGAEAARAGPLRRRPPAACPAPSSPSCTGSTTRTRRRSAGRECPRGGPLRLPRPRIG